MRKSKMTPPCEAPLVVLLCVTGDNDMAKAAHFWNTQRRNTRELRTEHGIIELNPGRNRVV